MQSEIRRRPNSPSILLGSLPRAAAHDGFLAGLAEPLARPIRIHALATQSARTLEPVKKLESAAREQERPYGKAHARAHPRQRAVTERTTRPDGVSSSRPQGCVSFWLDLRCSGGTAERRETACRRQPAGRCKASATPLRVLPPLSRPGQAKNPAATRHFVIFSQVLREFRLCGSPLTKAGKARNRRILIGPATRQALSNAPGLWRRIRCSDILSVVADMRLWLWRVAGL